MTGLTVRPASVREPRVRTLLTALTVELAGEGYTAAQTFGLSVQQLEDSGVHLMAASVGEELVGVAGVDLQEDGYAELRRFYVDPAHRGGPAASALLTALLDHACAAGRHTVRLETGDRQQRAIGFYTRHGFVVVARFGPYVDSATSICLSRPVGHLTSGTPG